MSHKEPAFVSFNPYFTFSNEELGSTADFYHSKETGANCGSPKDSTPSPAGS